MALTQQHGSRPFASPHVRLSERGSGAVCSLSQERHGHITLEDGPGGKLLIADGAVRSDIRLYIAVPELGDAGLAEAVTAGEGYRDFEAVQAYDAGQV